MTVRDFTIAVTDEELDDLRRRLVATRWPRPPHAVGWQQGTDIVWLQNAMRVLEPTLRLACSGTFLELVPQ